MTHRSELQISAHQPGAALTPEQKRFNTLIRQIEHARGTLAAWQENLPGFQRTYVQAMEPLRCSFIAARKEWAFALDALLDQRGWSKAERATLRDVVCDTAGDLLEIDADDAALKTLFDKHSDTDFDTEKQQGLELMKEVTELFTGMDLGETDDLRTDEDLLRRVSEQMEENAKREAERASARQRGRKNQAQKRRETEAQLTTHSIRDIYRKLASALHPDREADPTRRQEKTDWMQKINRAYEAQDLLTLLEAQMQLDANAVFGADPQRLKRYNQALAKQLDALKSEIQNVESAFRIEFAVEPFRLMDPRKLGGLIDERKRLLRADLAQHRHDMRLVNDRVAMKRWLKAQRQAMRDDEASGGLF